MVVLAGVFLNNSRAGWGLAVLVAGLVGGRFAVAWWRTERDGFDWRRALGQLLALVVLVIAFGALVVAGWTTETKEKLKRLDTARVMLQERYPAEVYHQMVRELSWLGHGPDCFQVAAPDYMRAFGLHDEKYGFWRHAHNDYYEYLLNWGWWGAASWAVLFGGGLGLALWGHFRGPVNWGSSQWTLGYCGAVGMIAIMVHACWDFPLNIPSLLLWFLTLLADGWARCKARDSSHGG